MRALRMTGWKSEPELVEVEEPRAGPGQVVLRVGGAGACHSDLHIMEDFDASMGLPWALPFTLGHENAGWVHALGADVRGLEVGQPVALHGPWGCGRCGRCQTGAENYCENPLEATVVAGGCGLGADGGMAELLLVPDARHLVPLPDGLDPVLAAPLTDAGLTPYHAIARSRAKLDPTSTAVVIGVGGLGHLAIQILKAVTPARVIAIDNKPSAQALATRFGADHVLPAGDATVFEVRGATPGGRGADLVLDFVGSDATLRTAIGCARTMGDVTLVGIAGGSVPFGFLSMGYEVSLQTTYWGSRPELVDLLDLAARGLVTPVITTFELDRAADAYRQLHDGSVEGRAVVVPNPT